jgi:hypothetical protein
VSEGEVVVEKRRDGVSAKPASPTAIDTPAGELHVQINAGYSIHLEATRLPILFLAIPAPLKLND